MPYAEMAIAIASAAFFVASGEMGARTGSADHGFIWAAISILLSGVAVFVFHASTIGLIVLQVGLFFGIGVVRGMMDS